MTNLSTSVRDIIRIAVPLIIGSLGHNIISLTDTVVLGRYGEAHVTEFAAIGLMAPAYLLITMIGMAISRGAQILIARRVGEGRSRYVGRIAQNMLYFEVMVATVFLIFTLLFGYQLLATFIDTEGLLNACWDFLHYRIWGIYFTFVGTCVIALYSGIGRTKIIIINALVLAGVNVLLNYVLVFGMFGLPEMGIRGSALASIIAEGIGLCVFALYLFLDKENRKYHLFYLPPIDFNLIKIQARLSAPIALQSFFGMGSWLLFFAMIEDYGQDALAASNAVRVIYLFLGVPTWGMSNATTTIISQLVGKNKRNEVFPTLSKIALVNAALTFLLAVSLLIFPTAIVSITSTSPTVIHDAVPLLPLLFLILMSISISNIYYNGIVGVGAIGISLTMQIVVVCIYVAYIITVVRGFHASLQVAWCAEMVYFALILLASMIYMRTSRWYSVDL